MATTKPEISTSAFFKGLSEADSKRYEADITKAREEGRKEGYAQARVEILSWLQTTYVEDTSLDRRSPQAKAMIELASKVQDEFRRRAS